MPDQVVDTLNHYPHDENHDAIWGTEVPNNTPIARAWARLFDAGVHIGSPTSREYSLPGSDQLVRQNFAYAFARLYTNTTDNPNKTVRFYDARGFIASESGL